MGKKREASGGSRPSSRHCPSSENACETNRIQVKQFEILKAFMTKKYLQIDEMLLFLMLYLMRNKHIIIIATRKR